jgi:hypothetical protein
MSLTLFLNICENTIKIRRPETSNIAIPSKNINHASPEYKCGNILSMIILLSMLYDIGE